MSLINGMFGTGASAAAITLGADVADAVQAVESSKLRDHSHALDLATSRLANLLDVSAAIDAIGVESADARKMARYTLASALADMSMPADLATTETAGLESEGSEPGLEAFSTIKEYAIKAIEWLQKKWKEFKSFIAKYFNKYFGDVERLKKAWLKILEKSKEYQQGYSLEKNAKHEFEKGSEAFYLGDKMVTPEQMVEGIKQYRELTELLGTKVLDYEIKDLEPKDLLTEAGVMKTGTSLTGAMGLVNLVNTFKNIAKTAINDKAPTKFQSDAGTKSDEFLGRVCFYVARAAESAFGSLDGLKAFRFGFGDLTEDQKPKGKANMDLASAGAIEKLADANIELLDSVINIQRGKQLDKNETKLDKASKSLDSWKKDAPAGDESTEVRTGYREGVKFATEYFSVCRRILVALPLEVCDQARYISSMQKDFGNKSLSAHKKD